MGPLGSDTRHLPYFTGQNSVTGPHPTVRKAGSPGGGGEDGVWSTSNFPCHRQTSTEYRRDIGRGTSISVGPDGLGKLLEGTDVETRDPQTLAVSLV